MYHGFSTPAALNAQIVAEVAVSGLISAGDQTAIAAYFPTGSTWPTLTQIEAAENLTRGLFDTAMNTARATGNNATVAAVVQAWDRLCGFENIFDQARESMLFALTPTS